MDWSSLAMETAARLGEASIRAVALALAGAVLTFTLRRRSAAARHGVWTAVLAGMLALPWVQDVVPVAAVQLPQGAAAWILQGGSLQGESRAEIRPAVVVDGNEPAEPGTRLAIAWPALGGALYLAVSLWLLLRVAAGAFWVNRLRSGARRLAFELDEYPAGDPASAWYVAESAQVCAPVTAGCLRPLILLPPGWRAWERDKLRAVLAHERAHVRRRDPLVALLARLNSCVFWFHPLASWLEGRLARLAEHAADDAALAEALDPRRYAQVVLGMAESLGPGWADPAGGGGVEWASACRTAPPPAGPGRAAPGAPSGRVDSRGALYLRRRRAVAGGGRGLPGSGARRTSRRSSWTRTTSSTPCFVGRATGMKSSPLTRRAC